MHSVIANIPIFCGVAALVWGIYVFNKQQKFNRLQNLSKILQRFGEKREFLDLFNLFDQSINIERQKMKISYNKDYLDRITNEDAEDKLQFLVLLEEVALYARSFEVDRDYAIHLFQWHFYFIYNNPETSRAFWDNIGGVEEINQSYWGYQKQFSEFCRPVLF